MAEPLDSVSISAEPSGFVQGSVSAEPLKISTEPKPKLFSPFLPIYDLKSIQENVQLKEFTKIAVKNIALFCKLCLNRLLKPSLSQ